MRPVSGCSQVAVGAFCASRFAVERGFLDPKPTCRAQQLGARSSSGSRPRCLPRHGSLRDRPGGGGDAERVSDGIPFALNHKLAPNRFRCTRITRRRLFVIVMQRASCSAGWILNTVTWANPINPILSLLQAGWIWFLTSLRLRPRPSPDNARWASIHVSRGCHGRGQEQLPTAELHWRSRTIPKPNTAAHSRHACDCAELRHTAPPKQSGVTLF